MGTWRKGELTGGEVFLEKSLTTKVAPSSFEMKILASETWANISWRREQDEGRSNLMDDFQHVKLGIHVHTCTYIQYVIILIECIIGSSVKCLYLKG